MTIDSLLDEFLLYIVKVKNLGQKTVDCYSKSIKLFIKESGVCDLEDVNERVCTAFVKNLSASGFSPNSINRHISALRQFFSYLVKSGYTSSDPFMFIKSRKRTKKIPTFLTHEELKRLIDISKGSCGYIDVLDRCIVCMLVFTGMRRSELLGLKCTDINYTKNEILVHGKGRKDRIVYFTDYCKAAMNAYRDIRLKADSDLFFIDENSRPCTQAHLTKLFKNLSELDFNNKQITPHVLRHSFATLLINNAVDVSYIQRLLGHSSVLSSDVYVHTNMNEMYEKYDRAFVKGGA